MRSTTWRTTSRCRLADACRTGGRPTWITSQLRVASPGRPGWTTSPRYGSSPGGAAPRRPSLDVEEVVAVLQPAPQSGAPGRGVPHYGVGSRRGNGVARLPPPSVGHRGHGGSCFLCECPVVVWIDERARGGLLKPADGAVWSPRPTLGTPPACMAPCGHCAAASMHCCYEATPHTSMLHQCAACIDAMHTPVFVHTAPIELVRTFIFPIMIIWDIFHETKIM